MVLLEKSGAKEMQRQQPRELKKYSKTREKPSAVRQHVLITVCILAALSNDEPLAAEPLAISSKSPFVYCVCCPHLGRDGEGLANMTEQGTQP